MDRRDMLKSVATLTAAAGLAAGGSAAAERPSTGPSKTLSQNRLVTRDGTTLFYRDWGSGRPVVLLHSWAVNSDMWQYQVQALTAAGLRCVTYDRRGHGRSDQPDSGYSYDALADDLADALTALDLRDVVLVGHSMGGGEVVRYLTRHGQDRVSRIVLVSSTTPLLVKTADNPGGVDPALLEGVRGLWRKDFHKWIADNAAPFFTPETSAPMREWAMGLMAPTSVKVALDCNAAVAGTDFRAELPKVGVPTLILHGDADVSAPLALTGEKTARLIPASVLKVYAGGPHGIFLTHMDQLNRDLIAFAKG